MPRLFTGLAVPPEVAQALAFQRGGLAGARWVEPESYHLTLRFLGDIDRRTAEDVDEGLAGMRPRSPIEVVLDGLSAFGGDRPRALIAHAVPSEALADLQAEHERIARRVGMAPETRRYTPHVTLARLARGTAPGEVAAWLAERAFTPLRFVARAALLYSARDGVGGGPYLVEAEYPFAGGDDEEEDR